MYPWPRQNACCFNGLPYYCEFPQIKIVCQQIRGHSVHNFAVAEIVNAVLIVGGVAFEKAAHTASHSARTPPERVTRRHRLALQTIENRVRPSERIGQFMN